MDTELRAHLLTLADTFARERSLERSTLGKNAAGDWRFFDRLEGGSGFTTRKYDEVVAWFRARWPEGVDFPPLKIPSASEAAA